MVVQTLKSLHLPPLVFPGLRFLHSNSVKKLGPGGAQQFKEKGKEGGEKGSFKLKLVSSGLCSKVVKQPFSFLLDASNIDCQSCSSQPGHTISGRQGGNT